MKLVTPDPLDSMNFILHLLRELKEADRRALFRIAAQEFPDEWCECSPRWTGEKKCYDRSVPF